MVEPSKIPTSEITDQVILSRQEYEKLLANESKIAFLQLEIEKLKRMIFGTKSERFAPLDPSQLSMELGQTTQPTDERPTEQITYARQKPEKEKGHARMEISSSIPREVVVIEP
jgi:hypothetical protein